MNGMLEIWPRIFVRAPLYSVSKYDVKRLPEVLKDPFFKNALFLASPGLYLVLRKKGFRFGRLNLKERLTIFKYYNRMCFRATPFGAFATVGLCAWKGPGPAYMAAQEKSMIVLLPDQALMVSLAPCNKADLSSGVSLNPSCYKLGKQLRFIRSVKDHDGNYGFCLASAEYGPVHKMLSRFFSCGRTLDALIRRIMRYAGCSREDASGYAGFLLDEQIILGTDHRSLITAAKSLRNGLPPEMKVVFGLPAFTGSWNAAKAHRHLLRTHWPEAKPPAGSLFYACLTRKIISGGIDDAHRPAILDAVHALARLAPPVNLDDLAAFITAFSARYDRRSVPLMEALDPDTGISYADLAVPNGRKGRDHQRQTARHDNGNNYPAWSAVHSLLADVWLSGRDRGSSGPVVLTAAHLGIFGTKDSVKMPPGVPVIFRSTAAGLVIDQAGGVSGLSIIGRFSQFDERVAGLGKKIAEYEMSANPEVAFAEISVMTGGHADNINRRSAFYACEIPVNVNPGSPVSKQLPLSDLWLSVRDGELVLWSKKLGRRVIPRLSTAYNYKKSELAVFRLLGDLQYQGVKASLSFDPESYFPGMGYYPRVQFGEVIISLAKWVIAPSVLAEMQLLAASPDPLKNIRRLQRSQGWPNLVMLGNHDQRLVFDLSDRDEVSFFIEILQGVSGLTLYEYLPADSSLRSGYRTYAGEYVAIVHNKEPVYKGLTTRALLTGDTPERRFVPGSSWTYFKIYCSQPGADSILTGVIAPFLERYGHLLDKWFFIRYKDPGEHLRFRILSSTSGGADILSCFNEVLKAADVGHFVRDLQLGTYEREVERYGAENVQMAETLFSSGSRLVLDNLQADAPVTESDLAFLTSWNMLLSFLPDLAALKEFCSLAFGMFGEEFEIGKQEKIALDMRFREGRGHFKDLLENGLRGQAAATLSLLLDDCVSFSLKISGKPRQRKFELFADLIHMQMNRTFSAGQREQEMVNYYMLHKYAGYVSALAKQSVKVPS